MRIITAAALALALIVPLVGCESDSSKNISGEALDARILAAKQVSDQQQRDLALRQAALDAARAQRVEIARRALSDIADNNMRDKTAAEAAMKFHDNKMWGQARELANMIGDPQLKDQTYLHMAGSPSQSNR